MSLTTGTRLGPYEIVEQIGAGGMGEVYKARDTRLDRTVAIKVLPSHLADNPDLKQRLEREARAVSSLNHPHICTLHDVGEENGTAFLVMEYIEGKTLADRLKKGAVPLDQALRMAVQIADALEKAHRHGVVHRDLKPGNIMITKEGAKLLDFGLAKLRTDVSAETSSVLSALPTEEKPLTEKGTILGTFQYMAPEQLEGKEVDVRTDVFAFGSVIYEMVTGQRAFEGKSQASLIAAIMSTEPPSIRGIEPLTPRALDKTVRTCLDKDADERWQTFTDLKRELLWISEGEIVSAKPLPEGRTRRVGWVAGMLVAVAATGVIIWNLRAPEPPRVTHLQMNLEPAERLQSNGQFNRPSRTAFAISPDGRHIVFSGQAGGVTQLYRRALDQERATPIPGTEDGVSPFFSPDGQWVAFFASGQLRKVPVSGGTVSTVCDTSANNIYGASWGDDGHIVFSLQAGGLSRVNAYGGDIHPLTTLDTDQGEASHRLPNVLPGSRAVLFTTMSAGDTDKVVVQEPATGEKHTLIEEGSDGRYSKSGHLVYVKSGTLMAAPFDPIRLTLAGSSVPLQEEVMQSSGSSTPSLEAKAAQYSLSDNGTLIYLPGGIYPDERRFLTWVDRTGNEERLDLPLRHYLWPRLAPDGQRLAVNVGGGFNINVFVIDLIRGTTTRLTTSGEAGMGLWTPDGGRYFFGLRSGGSASRVADMSGEIETLTESEYWHAPSSLTPGGGVLAYVEINPDTGRDIWLLDIKNGGEPRPLMQTPAHEEHPVFSPDGRWLVYASNESGQFEVYVQSYPDAGKKYQISTDGGVRPLWSKDGRELFYRKGDQLLAVSIEIDKGFAAGRPRVLFEGDYIAAMMVRAYDISNDGKRFLMIGREPFPDTPITQIHVVLNWTEELKRLVPTN